jgi:hypothetical protein
MKYIIVMISMLIPSALFGQVQQHILAGSYHGSWARTVWSYTFNSDNTYQYETNGHFGNTYTTGKFEILNDTVFLSPYPKEQQRNELYYHHKDTLLIDGDSCLIQISLRYDYCKRKKSDRFIIHSSKIRAEAKKPDE